MLILLQAQTRVLSLSLQVYLEVHLKTSNNSQTTTFKALHFSIFSCHHLLESRHIPCLDLPPVVTSYHHDTLLLQPLFRHSWLLPLFLPDRNIPSVFSSSPLLFRSGPWPLLYDAFSHLLWWLCSNQSTSIYRLELCFSSHVHSTSARQQLLHGYKSKFTHVLQPR